MANEAALRDKTATAHCGPEHAASGFVRQSPPIARELSAQAPITERIGREKRSNPLLQGLPHGQGHAAESLLNSCRNCRPFEAFITALVWRYRASISLMSFSPVPEPRATRLTREDPKISGLSRSARVID